MNPFELNGIKVKPVDRTPVVEVGRAISWGSMSGGTVLERTDPEGNTLNDYHEVLVGSRVSGCVVPGESFVEAAYVQRLTTMEDGSRALVPEVEEYRPGVTVRAVGRIVGWDERSRR